MRRFKRYAAFTDALRRCRNALLVSHTKPDGDALGSLAAARIILRQLGVSTVPVLFEDLPGRYSLFDAASFRILRKGETLRTPSEFDCVVVLDTCAYSQLEPIADWLQKSAIPKFAIDHHRTRDDLADHYVIDESASANCLILYEWAMSLRAECEIDRHLGDALFIGIATDTGWFRHSNTDQRTFAAAAELIGRGVEAHRLFEQLYLRDSEARVRLLGAALQSLELHAGGRLACMTLLEQDFRRTSATRADTEDIINEPLRIATAVISVLLVEDNGGVIRVSLRSRTPGDGVPDIDVAAIAQRLGGGGHSRAAGVRIPGAFAAVRRRVLEEITQTLSAARAPGGTVPP